MQTWLQFIDYHADTQQFSDFKQTLSKDVIIFITFTVCLRSLYVVDRGNLFQGSPRPDWKASHWLFCLVQERLHGLGRDHFLTERTTCCARPDQSGS